jgi:hypothetical protein
MRKRGAKIHNLRRDASPFVRAFASKVALSPARLHTLAIGHHMSLQAVRDGRGTDADMGRLAEALNVAMVLSDRGFGRDELPNIKAAQRELVDAEGPSRKAGRWILSERAYHAVGDALEIHDQQLELATEADVQAAAIAVKSLGTAGEVIRFRPERTQ